MTLTARVATGWGALGLACNVHGPLVTEKPVTRSSLTGIQTSWLGNTHGGADQSWEPRTVSGLFASADGTIYWTGEDPTFDGQPSTRIYKHGQQLGELLNQNRTLAAGSAITGNASTVYAAVVQRADAGAAGDLPPVGRLWNGFRVHHLDGTPAPFAGGRGPDKNMVIVNEIAELGDGSENSERIIALAMTHDEVYAASTASVTAYAAVDLSELRSFERPAIRALLGGPDDSLWSIDGTPATVRHLGKTGDPLDESLAGLDDPRALARDTEGQLLVALEGSTSTVQAYALSEGPPKLVHTYGETGGLRAARGVVGNGRWLGLSAVAADGTGNVYVGMNGGPSFGARLVKLTRSGEPEWEIHSLVSHEGATVDPISDGVEIVSTRARFRMSYGEPPGQQAQWVGWSIDAARFPNDPRLRPGGANAIVVRALGQRFVCTTSSAPGVTVFRTVPGSEALAPAVRWGSGAAPNRPDTAAFTEARAWFWRDDSGDGEPQAAEYQAVNLGGSWSAWVDEVGTMWWATEDEGVDSFALPSVDAHGVPSYSTSLRKTLPMPAPFERLQAIQVVHATDSAYLSGYTSDHPNPYGTEAWTSIGTELARYDDFTTKPHLRFRIELPIDSKLSHRPWAFAVGGDKLFVTYVNDESIYVFNSNDGSPLGHFQAGPEINGWLGTSRTWMSLSAFQRANGESLLLAADNPHSKVTLFRLPPDWRGD